MNLSLYGDARKSDGRVVITIDWEAINSDFLLAGSPFGSDGRIHNDEKCIGIVASDCEPRYNGTVEVIVAGMIDKAEAESNSGIVLSKKALSAMSNIRFTNDERFMSLINKE